VAVIFDLSKELSSLTLFSGFLSGLTILSVVLFLRLWLPATGMSAADGGHIVVSCLPIDSSLGALGSTRKRVQEIGRQTDNQLANYVSSQTMRKRDFLYILLSLKCNIENSLQCPKWRRREGGRGRSITKWFALETFRYDSWRGGMDMKLGAVRALPSSPTIHFSHLLSSFTSSGVGHFESHYLSFF